MNILVELELFSNLDEYLKIDCLIDSFKKKLMRLEYNSISPVIKIDI